MKKTGFTPLKAVDSSMIKRISYHEDDETLLVCFNTGRDYYFENVPKYVYKELLAANKRDGASVGKLFISLVRSEPNRRGRVVNSEL